MSNIRFDKLAGYMEKNNLDAVAINPGQTLTYLTGLHFHLMERPTVVLYTPGKDPVIVLPELEAAKTANLPYAMSVFTYAENPAEWHTAFEKAVGTLNINGKTIGVEPRALRILEYRFIEQAAPQSSFPDASLTLAELRLRKDADEIAKMRKAVKIAQDGLEAALKLFKVGMTEMEFSNELVIQLLRNGSQPEMPFSPIVSGGPNTANPHASPTDRKVQHGDLFLVDWGAAYEGYISDLTRTFAVGDVDAKFLNIHKIVQEANAAGRAAGKPGVPCANVDIAARDVITMAGYGPLFRHRTGHGIGMEGHEEPYMRGDNMQILEPGMCYTVEPGIYMLGEGGVRIEDNMVITETGVESMSDMPREVRVIG